MRLQGRTVALVIATGYLPEQFRVLIPAILEG